VNIDRFHTHPSPADARSKRSAAGPVLAVSAVALAATALFVRHKARKAEREHPPAGRFLTVDGVRLHYVDTGGDGPVVVLLHGNGAMIADMEISGLIDQASATCRVIVFDRPGYGHSDRPRSTVWTPEAQADLFSKAFARLGIRRPIVVGHSWGTLVALALAFDHPNEVGGLVLVSGYYFPTARIDVALFSAPAIPVLGDVMRYTISPLIGRAIAPSLLRRIFAPRPVTARFDREFPVELALRPSQIRASAEETALMIPAATRFKEHYRDLRLPVVIMTGAGDRITDVQRQAVRLHHAIPQSDLRVVPGFGHMLHHFAAAQIVDAIGTVAARAKPPMAANAV